MRYSLLGRIMLLLLLAWFAIPSVWADKKTNADPVLKKYFSECMSQLHSPVLLKMADTLYDKACQAQNKYYQVLARHAVLDYYYFKNDKDNFLKLVPGIKQMSREYNQLNEYYFIWGSRLITFYLKNGLTNHALIEAQNMLREAQNDKFSPGIAECYKAMANIYQIQSNSEQAASNFRRLIDLVNESEEGDINLPVYYFSLIDNLLQNSRTKEAGEALREAQLYLNKVEDVTAYQKLCIAQANLAYYIKKKDITRIKKAIGDIEELFSTYDELAVFTVYLRESRLKYYLEIKDYSNALAIMDSIERFNPSSEVEMFILNKRGEIYWSMNDHASAAKYFRDYISASDSTRKESMQKSADEIAGIFNLRQLEQEKQQLKIDIQNRRLYTTYWAIGALIIILLIAGFVIVHVYRLNRKLKESKQIVDRQNIALLHSSEELRKSKERAEEASRLKTDFIQNITHEVRTPLNSIVGFAQVLVECYKEPETEEFASLITVNSSYLLRLFDDVLELSNADQAEQLPYDIVDDINTGCYLAIEESKPFVADGVELIFRPSEDHLRITTNPPYVKLILCSLLHNAAKFTNTGNITLTYEILPVEGVIRYTVTDTGIGIPSNLCEVVFERFKKLNSFSQGFGLGLSVARALATKLGGDLSVDANYTKGARLVLLLPFIPE